MCTILGAQPRFRKNKQNTSNYNFKRYILPSKQCRYSKIVDFCDYLYKKVKYGNKIAIMDKSRV